MKKITLEGIIRTIAIIFALVMLSVALVACSGDDELGFEPPEYAFLSESIVFPGFDEMMDIGNVILVEDRLFFTGTSMDIMELGGDHMFFSQSAGVYSMGLEEEGFIAAPNFVPGNAPPDAVIGWSMINGMQADDDGNIWIAETAQAVILDYPADFDFVRASDDDVMMHQTFLDVSNSIRKLDNTGAELLSIDLNAFGGDSIWVSSFTIDSDGNLYVGIEDRIYVFDPLGNLLFDLHVQGWGSDLVSMPDGTVVNAGWGSTGMELQAINFADRTWGSTSTLPGLANNVLAGSDEFPILYSDGMNLIAYNPDTDESMELLNTIESGVSTADIESILFLEDERIMVITQSWRMGTQMMEVEATFLTRIPFTDLPERTILTLATINLDWILRDAVLLFNRTHNQYFIQVIDYSRYDDGDLEASMNRMILDLFAGRVPDMVHIQGPVFRPLLQSELLEDLYPFIDNDPEFNRSDLMDDILTNIEIDGALYRIFPHFIVSTIVGHPDVLGEYPGWTMDDFYTALEDNPQADLPMGQIMTAETFLSESLFFNMSQFVNWETGEVYFDSEDFIQLMQTAGMLPLYEYGEWDVSSEAEMIATGRQIMNSVNLASLVDYLVHEYMFGGDLVFKGFPTEDRTGHTVRSSGNIVMTNVGENQDGVWQFFRSFLTTDFQRSYIWNFPVNRAVFDEKLQEQMENPAWITSNGYMIEAEPLTQQAADRIFDLFTRVTPSDHWEEDLWNIISEGASDYFTGVSSAEDAARVIQNRAMIFMSERMG